MKLTIKNTDLTISNDYLFLLEKGFFKTLRNKLFFEGTIWDIEALTIPLEELNISANENVLAEYGLDNNNPIYIDEFYTNKEDALNKWSTYIDNNPLFEKKLLPIGNLSRPNNAALLLGINKSNSGQIWVNFSDYDHVIKIANSISELLDKLVITPYELPFTGLSINQMQSKMYKNFDENFWRLK
ncbi:MAG: hypothetical protein AB8H03_22235 [Saprospiraceae bacterium]